MYVCLYVFQIALSEEASAALIYLFSSLSAPFALGIYVSIMYVWSFVLVLSCADCICLFEHFIACPSLSSANGHTYGRVHCIFAMQFEPDRKCFCLRHKPTTKKAQMNMNAVHSPSCVLTTWFGCHGCVCVCVFAVGWLVGFDGFIPLCDNSETKKIILMMIRYRSVLSWGFPEFGFAALEEQTPYGT